MRIKVRYHGTNGTRKVMKNSGKLSKYLQFARRECEILYLNTKFIRNLIFNRNQGLSEISVRSKEIKEIRESYQIHAICVVYTKFFLLYQLGLIMKKKKKCVWISLFY